MTAQGTLELRSGKFAGKVRAIAASGGLALAINFGCTDRLPVEAAFDVLDTPMTVTGADPAEGEQGETLEVRVFGTGFEDDAVPAWQRNGVADIEIHVIRSDFVSSTELRAVISIAPNAEIGIRDIAVSSDRKKGIGSESPTAIGRDLFAVRQYVPQVLGFLSEGLWSGTVSYAAGINNDGVVAGTSFGPVAGGPGRQFAVYWTAASGIVSIVEDFAAYGSGINNKGWIIGGGGAGGFIFEDGIVTYLPRRGPYAVLPQAINDAGTIVGYANGPVVLQRVPPSISKPRLDAHGPYESPMLLPLLAGYVSAWVGAINDKGDIVGSFSRSPAPFVTESRAVLWKARPDGTYEDPLVLGGANGSAGAINDAGWIVGFMDGNNTIPSQAPIARKQMQAVLWHPDDYSNPILLEGAGGVETFASAINNHGQIVGERRDLLWDVFGASCCVAYVGVLWDVDASGRTVGTSLISPSPGYDLVRAVRGINDAGWIVGESGRSRGGGNEATLWRPR